MRVVFPIMWPCRRCIWSRTKSWLRVNGHVCLFCPLPRLFCGVFISASLLKISHQLAQIVTLFNYALLCTQPEKPHLLFYAKTMNSVSRRLCHFGYDHASNLCRKQLKDGDQLWASCCNTNTKSLTGPPLHGSSETASAIRLLPSLALFSI